MKSGLPYIAANLHFLSRVIQALDGQRLSLTESFVSVSWADTVIYNLPSSKGETIKQKYEYVYARNLDIAVLRSIEPAISENKGVLPDGMVPQKAFACKFALSRVSTLNARFQCTRLFSSTTLVGSHQKILPKF